MARQPVRTPDSVEIRNEPRVPALDPTLGIPVAVDRSGEPTHRLVTLGDSLTQGFMSAAVFRTELSWPALVAYELGVKGGLGAESGFRFPTFEPPGGPGGLPLDLERFARQFESRFGEKLDAWEMAAALHWLRRYLDGIEDYWERGAGKAPPEVDRPYHNLAMYGWDLLDASLLTDDLAAARIKRSRDHALSQMVQDDSSRAARVILRSCRSTDGEAMTVVEAARAMGEDGVRGGGGSGHGIETLVVVLGANNALGSVVSLTPRWTPDDYLDDPPLKRLTKKGPCNVWQPPHFDADWQLLVEQLRGIKARHVILATVPQVTIAPIARGVGGKVRVGSRYFNFYTKPWIDDQRFDPRHDPCLFESEARAIDSAIDHYNETIVNTVRDARRQRLDWYVFDLGGSLDRMASRRYLEDPSARPNWWTPYPLPVELATLTPPPDTRFFLSGPSGRRQGGIFSLDGVHPTTSTYAMLAQEIVTIMDVHARVPFVSRQGVPRAQGTVRVDFARALAADTLLSRPPAAVSSTLGLVGWLDQVLDWTRRLVPGL